jgi:hypothetical protein
LHTLLLPTLLLIGVSLCEVLDLVVSFPTSPISLKADSYESLIVFSGLDDLPVLSYGRF